MDGKNFDDRCWIFDRIVYGLTIANLINNDRAWKTRDIVYQHFKDWGDSLQYDNSGKLKNKGKIHFRFHKKMYGSISLIIKGNAAILTRQELYNNAISWNAEKDLQGKINFIPEISLAKYYNEHIEKINIIKLP